MNTAATAAPTAESVPVSRPAGGESLIDRDSHFNGLYETRQNLRIEGLAEGEIQCQGTLTVAEGAKVKAKVTASTITIAGELDGEVTCRGVFQILPSGQVQASVSAHRLIVQEGGLYNGEFRMISVQPSEDPPVSLRESPTATGEDSDDPEIGSDEWWRRFNAGELAGATDARNVPDDNT